jgi:4'-phosphopantetheinyl transferase
MTAPGWLTSLAAEVPSGDAWLSTRERAVLGGLRMAKRRDDWRLGRWTAKAAVAAWLGVGAERVEVLAAPDGAPDAWLDGAPAPVSLSLSHRAGRALAAVTDLPAAIGCDLEVVEHRSGPFVREWLTTGEQAALEALDGAARDVAANLMWAGKEAAAKVRRDGLRLDVRRADVELGVPGAGWRPLTVRWSEGQATEGWWCAAAGWVMTIAATPAPAVPSRLAAGP